MLQDTIVNGYKNKSTDIEQVKNAVLKLKTFTLNGNKNKNIDIKQKKAKKMWQKLFTK